jgi:hypothetical protein
VCAERERVCVGVSVGCSERDVLCVKERENKSEGGCGRDEWVRGGESE